MRDRTFDILEFEVKGNTQLSDSDIQTVLEPFLGSGHKAADVDQARGTLERLYNELGYKTVTVVIPRQTLKDGVVQLQVVEGKVERLNVVGSKYTSIEQVKSEVPSLAEGEVPNFERVQKDLLYANRFQKRHVTPSLRAGNAPGTVNIDLAVEDRMPLNLSSEFNNRHNQGTTEERLNVGAGYDNLFQVGHSISLFFQIAPQRPDDGRVYIANYLARFGDGSWNLLASYFKTDSNVTSFAASSGSGTGASSSPAGPDVIGAGTTYGIKLIKQLPDAGGSLFPSVSLGVDDKRTFNRVQLPPAVAGQPLPAAQETPVHYYPVTLGYSQLLRLESQSNQSDLALTFASYKFGSSGDQVDASRLGSRSQFSIRASNDYNIDFFHGFEFDFKIAGQITDRPLITSEQFGAGGMDTVRGYFEAEALGDVAELGSVELRAPSVPDLFAGQRWASVLSEFRPFVFFDAAHLSLRGPFPDENTPRAFSLSSFGAGVSIRIRDQLTALLDWAQPLRDGPASHKGDSQLLFRVSAQLGN